MNGFARCAGVLQVPQPLLRFVVEAHVVGEEPRAARGHSLRDERGPLAPLGGGLAGQLPSARTADAP